MREQYAIVRTVGEQLQFLYEFQHPSVIRWTNEERDAKVFRDQDIAQVYIDETVLRDKGCIVIPVID